MSQDVPLGTQNANFDCPNKHLIQRSLFDSKWLFASPARSDWWINFLIQINNCWFNTCLFASPREYFGWLKKLYFWTPCTGYSLATDKSLVDFDQWSLEQWPWSTLRSAIAWSWFRRRLTPPVGGLNNVWGLKPPATRAWVRPGVPGTRKQRPPPPLESRGHSDLESVGG